MKKSSRGAVEDFMERVEYGEYDDLFEEQEEKQEEEGQVEYFDA